MPSGDGRWVHQKRFGRSVSKHKVLPDLLRTSEFFLLLRAENLKLSAQISASQSCWLLYPIYCGSVLSGLQALQSAQRTHSHSSHALNSPANAARCLDARGASIVYSAQIAFVAWSSPMDRGCSIVARCACGTVLRCYSLPAQARLRRDSSCLCIRQSRLWPQATIARSITVSSPP